MPDSHLPPRRPLLTILSNLLLVTVVIAVSLLAFRLDRQLGISLPAGWAWLTWPLMLAGIASITWAAVTMLRYSGATSVPGDPTRKFVSRGPYRYFRNPIYAGVALELFAAAFFTRSPAFLALAVLYLPGIHLYIVKLEEPRTAARLGQPYRDYLTSTPRWLPRLRPSSSHPER